MLKEVQKILSNILIIIPHLRHEHKVSFFIVIDFVLLYILNWILKQVLKVAYAASGLDPTCSSRNKI